MIVRMGRAANKPSLAICSDCRVDGINNDLAKGEGVLGTTGRIVRTEQFQTDVVAAARQLPLTQSQLGPPLLNPRRNFR